MDKWIGGLLAGILGLVLFVPLVWGGMMVVHAVTMGSNGGMMGRSMMGQSGHHSGGMMGGMMGGMHGTAEAGTDVSENPTQKRVQSDAVSGNQTVSFVLRTSFSNGMTYEGDSGAIDGMTNPTLEVSVGDTVVIHLRNKAGGQHDLVVPGLNVETEMLQRRGDTTTIRFVPTNPGEFTYICSVPGHRAAGMEGQIIVRPEGENGPESDATP